jgi:hypothetical protein
MLKSFEWIAVLAAVVLLLSVVGISYLSSPPSSQPREQQTTAQAEAEHQSEKQHSLRGFVRFMFPDAISIFTFWLTLATIGLGIVAVLQIGFLDRSEGIAAKTAQAARDSAEAAKLNADTLMRDEGAQLWMDEVKIYGIRTTPTALKLTFTIRNFGNSPGWVHHRPMYITFGAALPLQRAINQADTPDIMFVPSKHFTSGETTIPTVIPAPVINALLATNPTTFMFLHGSINYRDMFGRERRAGFAYQIKFGAGDVSESTPIVGNESYWDYQ